MGLKPLTEYCQPGPKTESCMQLVIFGFVKQESAEEFKIMFNYRSLSFLV